MNKIVVLLIIILLLICVCSTCRGSVNHYYPQPNNPDGKYLSLTYAYTTSPVKNTDFAFFAEYTPAKNVISFPGGNLPTFSEVQNKNSSTPVANLPIIIINQSGEKIAEGKTDNQGHLQLNALLSLDDNKIIVPGWKCWTPTSSAAPENPVFPEGWAVEICKQEPDPNSIYAFNPSF